MYILLALIVVLALLYFIRKWLMAEVASVEADFETDIAGAEKATSGVVQDIKAKL